MSVLLGVNIDHVATLRQARLGSVPDLLSAALTAEKAGADGITVHLREDRRHIQDADVKLLRRKIRTRLNLEMACTPEMVAFACRVKPDSVCLVPEKRAELTTEGGLNAASQVSRIKSAAKKLKSAGVIVSLFIAPSPKQVRAAYETGAECIELHTGTYADAKKRLQQDSEFRKLKDAGQLARSMGLTLNAGHGLDTQNVSRVARIKDMHELNIGFSIVARAVFIGLEKAVREMKSKLP